MTLYEAIQADKRKRAEMALTVASAPNTVVEAKPIVIDASALATLAVKVQKAEADIDRLERDIEDLNVLFDLANQEAELYHHAGNTKKEAQTIKSIIALRKRIYKAQADLAQARLTVTQTQDKMFLKGAYAW